MRRIDVDPVMALERALFAEDAWSEAMLRDEMSRSSRHYLVAEAVPPEGTARAEEPDGAAAAPIIGYAGLRAVPPEGDVQTIAVARSAWGSGVGTALLTELLAEAARREVTDVFLEVRSDNPRARELYRRFGFVEIGVRRGYYKDADAIVMRRSHPAGSGAAEGSEGVDEDPEKKTR
ncbi:ribosomal protein S18-alanine N-acetyltransferase [Spinactinospora alkalitolerans]|nr:ribosomal protein S18-alanine N-acetyltransferase [Spinactinospora alkalitolerans]